MSLEASQAMVDAYAEAKGLEKRKIITREDAEAARADFAVGDYVSFDHKRERWFGKIVSRGPMHATVMIQSPREGITGKIPYPSLQKEAPPRFAEKVAGIDKPAPGESITAWQARTGRARANPEDDVPEWDEEYAAVPTYAKNFKRTRVPVSQIASPFVNPVKQERVDELAALEDAGHTLPPIIVDGPGEVDDDDYPEEKYPFLDGHYPVVGEDVWYVHDGHHRTMLAIQRGERFIDALVME